MATYDLPAMVGRTANGQRIITLAGIEITNALTRKLERINRQVMDPWLRRRKEIAELYEAEYQRRIQLDRTDPFANLFAQLSIEIGQLIDELEVDQEAYAAEVESWHREKWRRAVLAGTRIDLGTLIGPAEAQETLGDFIARNTSLIRNVSDETRAKVADLVLRGLQERRSSSDVGREISRQLGISRRRALRIAQDQANKLNGALDRQRQREAGIEFWKWRHSGKRHFRPEHKARNGKIYTDKNAPQDLPGQLPFCGCTREAVIITDEDEAERIRNRSRGEPTGEQQAPAPPAPEPDPEPDPNDGIFSAINPAVTAATITVGKRLALGKELSRSRAEAAKHPAYQIDMEFRSRNANDRGQAKFGTGFTDEAASMIVALAPELDVMSDRIGIPRLRGFKTISGRKANANMGDGIMGVNGPTFNGFAAASRIGGGNSNADRLAELQREFDAFEPQMRGFAEQANALRSQIETARDAGNVALAETLMIQRAEISQEWHKLDRKRQATWRKLKKEQALSGQADKPVATWQLGDGAGKNRPWSAKEYFGEGIDKARALLYHEFGHHVHQYLGKRGHRSRFGPPPLERQLVEFFRNHDRSRMLSKYGTSDPYEWFAENFAAYAMGRRDLLDEAALELMDGIFDGSYSRNLG